MSNILSDRHRQWIARAAIETCFIESYADIGCYQGASMSWYAGNFPQLKLFGVDLNETALAECRAIHPQAALHHGDSREYLKTLAQFAEPVLFYMDTDWIEDKPRKRQELDIILSRWSDFVIIANSVNRSGHPLCEHACKPETVDGMFADYGKHFRQFIVPTYSHPELANGYVVLNHSPEMIGFQGQPFEDLLCAGL